MANYIARVELHSAAYQDYENLHASMQRRGFLRTIVANDGTKYQLPTATYVAEGSAATLEQACNAAVAATQETGKKYSLIVADWDSARWAGLSVV